MLTDYIYINNNSICGELCDKIVDMFESQETGKNIGITLGGVQTNIKDTIDYNIPNNEEKWKKINLFLNKELDVNVKKYVNIQIEKNKYNIFHSDYIDHTNFMIQRYIKNKGKYTYHNDFTIDFEKHKYRVLTYLWYLNDVEEGGETEFFGGEFKIQPKKGTLILFPASWTYPHCGKMPISSNKYIITGWLYLYIPVNI